MLLQRQSYCEMRCLIFNWRKFKFRARAQVNLVQQFLCILSDLVSVNGKYLTNYNRYLAINCPLRVIWNQLSFFVDAHKSIKMWACIWKCAHSAWLNHKLQLMKKSVLNAVWCHDSLSFRKPILCQIRCTHTQRTPSWSDTHAAPRWTHKSSGKKKERKSKTNAPVCKCLWIT